jgi:transposase InsO family protein
VVVVPNCYLRCRHRCRQLCFDNAVAESFFATYKKELIHTRPWDDLTEVQQHTFLWIEGYYNRRRRHSTPEILDTPRI